jgi:hypothetical protein
MFVAGTFKFDSELNRLLASYNIFYNDRLWWLLEVEMWECLMKIENLHHIDEYLSVLAEKVLFNIAPEEWCTCIMHMNLRVIGVMVVKGIFDKLGTNGNAQAQAEQMYEIFEKIGLYIKNNKLKKKTKKLDAYGFQKFSFCGSDAFLIDRAMPSLIEIVYPTDCLAKNPQARKDRTNVENFQKEWHQIWTLLNLPLPYNGTDTTKQVRYARAQEVRTLANKFRKTWIAAFGSTKHVYLHRLVAHVPGEIEVFGDLSKRQTQGLEHTNKIRKGLSRGGTNRQKKDATGTVLAKVLVRHKTRRLWDEGVVMVRNEKMKQQRIRRAKAKMERLQKMTDWFTRCGKAEK